MRRCRHLQLKAYLAAIAMVAGLVACGGGASDSPTSPGNPSVPSTPTGPTVTVSLGVDVPSQAVANITAFVTLGDSVGATKGATKGASQRAMSVVADSTSVPVFALNSVGDPIAAGFGVAGAPVSLTPTSTALVLVRVLFPVAATQAPDEQTLRTTIAQQSTFGLLVDSVSGAMSRGVTYATAAGVLAEAEVVVQAVLAARSAAIPAASQDVARAQIAPSRGARATIAVGPPIFTRYPVMLIGPSAAIGIITFSNPSFAPFSVDISPQSGTTEELPGETFCPLCNPAILGSAPPKKGYPGSNRAVGEFTATVAFGQVEQEAVATSFVVDVFTGILRAAAIDVSEDQLTSVLDTVAAAIDIQSAVGQATWPGAAGVLTKSIVTAGVPALVKNMSSIPGVGAAHAGATAFFRAAALPLAYVDSGLWADGHLPVYSDAAMYWSTSPEVIPFCFANLTMYNACATSVVVTLASDSVAVGGTVQASAVAITATGDTLTGLPVRWSITAGTATVAQSGLVTTTSAGSSSVTATFQQASGSATLEATAVP